MTRLSPFLPCLCACQSFIEEAVVRRELADNFCYYQPHYDSLQGAANWARESLELHTCVLPSCLLPLVAYGRLAACIGKRKRLLPSGFLGQAIRSVCD